MDKPETLQIIAEAIQQHIADKHARKKRVVKPKVPMAVGWFEEFWNGYPRTDDKSGAIKEWAKLDAELFYTIMAAVKAQKLKGGRLADMQYAPLASKWLHGKGWLDPIPTQRVVVQQKVVSLDIPCTGCGESTTETKIIRNGKPWCGIECYNKH